jgi:hypothetical protein
MKTYFTVLVEKSYITLASELTNTEIPAVSFSFYIQPPYTNKKLIITREAPDKPITATLHEVNHVK